MSQEIRIHQVSDRRTGRAWLILAKTAEEAESKWDDWILDHDEDRPESPEWYLVYGTVVQ